MQRCTLNLMDKEIIEEEIMEVEVQNNENLAVASMSNRKALVSNMAPLSRTFYEDKATETPFSDFFKLPQILNTDEKLSNFTGMPKSIFKKKMYLHYFFFLGINFDILNTIVKCARNTADFNNNCDWPNMKERVILVLCKFKLNISFACLAVLFKISKTQCTSMFYSTVSLLAVALKRAIYWPSKEEVLKNMPKCFGKFKNTRVVLDCTEIQIQRLKCLKCRVRSYSHYKGTQTIKYLIGITPSGLISLVSAGFGGRATDKAIFMYENVLDKLEIHDAVMVDKGFLIESECNDRLIKLIRPPFLRKKSQFSKEEAEATADIARARVHVERAIQRIKIFKILHEQLSWFLIPYADEIMVIIAAIVNLSLPILADTRIN